MVNIPCIFEKHVILQLLDAILYTGSFKLVNHDIQICDILTDFLRAVCCTSHWESCVKISNYTYRFFFLSIFSINMLILHFLMFGNLGFLYLFLIYSLIIIKTIFSNTSYLKAIYKVNIDILVFIYLFIYLYFWLRWVFIAACGLSLVLASGGYSLVWCVGFSTWWLLLLWSTGSRHTGFSSCGMWFSVVVVCGSRVQPQ